jgi:5-methylcytosine-specific restriction endonuclease McrA
MFIVGNTKREQERLEWVRLRRERLEQERLERVKLKQERLEQERLERVRLEQERLEEARLEEERLESERLMRERLEQERLERERIRASYKDCFKRIAQKNGEINEDLNLRENALKQNNRRVPSKVRNDVWVRDGGKCRICGSQENLHFDHIIPFSKGGGYTVKNIQILCSVCNLKKSNKIQ